VRGAILDYWASQGYENSRFGFPTSEEYQNPRRDGVQQNYQGGVINYIFNVGIRPPE